MSVRDTSIDSRLLSSARDEFMRHGFLKADLKTICDNAGVTTGAVYKRYNGKEELFCAVVKDTIDKLDSFVALRTDLDFSEMTDDQIRENAEYTANEDHVSAVIVLRENAEETELYSVGEDERFDLLKTSLENELAGIGNTVFEVLLLMFTLTDEIEKVFLIVHDSTKIRLSSESPTPFSLNSLWFIINLLFLWRQRVYFNGSDKCFEYMMCDTVITWAKENFMFISLIVGVIGVVIAFISLVYEIKKKKKGNK